MEQGGRPRQRAVPGGLVAVGVVAALAVAALALRPAEGLLHSGKGPLGHWGIVAIGSSAAWTVGVVLAVQRLRPRFNAYRVSLPAGEERLRETAGPLLIAGAGVIGVLALVLHRFSRGDDGPDAPEVLPTRFPTPTAPGRPVPSDGSGDASRLPSLPLYLVLGLLAAVVIVLVAVAVVRRLRRLGLRVPQRPDLAGTASEDDDARVLLSAVRSGRRALAGTGDARTAVIACYAGMEEALVASGIPRHASDSPTDLLVRAVAAGLAPEPAAPRLTALFREARFSSHPMDASHREAAADALEEIASMLLDREEAR
ncbi:DUF4129 domain-containing protein [Streptomyces mutabilis]|uniref:Membrane protein n=1 Tax=Streptomyces mutabilis TaxID=67332 RepID=A0A086MVX2_9ACTN|nr:DUF4129 domain-containing protein [Streptomyces mutabilis]KFG73040.1 membrane protein [Streptomyces mutabilis]